MSATRRQHVRRCCLRTLVVALVGTWAVGTPAGPALGAAPQVAQQVVPLVTGCGLLVTVPAGVVEAGIDVAALPSGLPLAVAFTGPLASAAGTTVALAGAHVGAMGVRVTLTYDRVAQPPVTLVLPGCAAALPGSATPTVDLSPSPSGTPVEGPSPVPASSPVVTAERQVTGLADLISPGPSPSPTDPPPGPAPTDPPLADRPDAGPASSEPPSSDAAGPAVPLLERPSTGRTAAEPTAADRLVRQLSTVGPAVADDPLARAQSASLPTAARFPASLSARALTPASLSPAASSGSSSGAGTLPQVALPATTPPHSDADASTLPGSELPITAASRLLQLGRPAAGADLATTAVLLAGALAVIAGQAARRRRWGSLTREVHAGVVTVSAPGR